MCYNKDNRHDTKKNCLYYYIDTTFYRFMCHHNFLLSVSDDCISFNSLVIVGILVNNTIFMSLFIDHRKKFNKTNNFFVICSIKFGKNIFKNLIKCFIWLWIDCGYCQLFKNKVFVSEKIK